MFEHHGIKVTAKKLNLLNETVYEGVFKDKYSIVVREAEWSGSENGFSRDLTIFRN